jgi:hypothetical protein
VLAAAPAAIPATVGIEMAPKDVLLPYFLSAAELAIAILSLGAIRLQDAAAIRLIALTFVLFHGATAVLELVYVAVAGFSPVLAANIAVRVAVAAVFAVIWWKRRRPPTPAAAPPRI